MWTVAYKSYLLKMAEKGLLKDIREFHTSEDVRFEVTTTMVRFITSSNEYGMLMNLLISI